MNDLEAFYGPNAGYVLELYDRYRQNPASVDSATRAIFDTWSPDSLAAGGALTETAPYAVSQIVAASPLSHALRPRGPPRPPRHPPANPTPGVSAPFVRTTW